MGAYGNAIARFVSRTRLETGYIGILRKQIVGIGPFELVAVFDALFGAPGVLSARYAGDHGDDKANNKKLLMELEKVPEDKRTAHYTCVIACAFPDGREFTVSGRCDGTIDFCESGAGGFGYDPLFISEIGKFSEVTAQEKDAVSHRGKAVRLFKEKLSEYLKW